jgi:hypothetical protein
MGVEGLVLSGVKDKLTFLPSYKTNILPNTGVLKSEIEEMEGVAAVRGSTNSHERKQTCLDALVRLKNAIPY